MATFFDVLCCWTNQIASIAYIDHWKLRLLVMLCRTQGLHKYNTVDLHGLHVDEALQVVQSTIAKRTRGKPAFPPHVFCVDLPCRTRILDLTPLYLYFLLYQCNINCFYELGTWIKRLNMFHCVVCRFVFYGPASIIQDWLYKTLNVLWVWGQYALLCSVSVIHCRTKTEAERSKDPHMVDNWKGSSQSQRGGANQTSCNSVSDQE